MPRVEIEIPDEVSADVDHLDVTVEGPEGTVTRRLWYPDISVTVEDVPTESDEDGETVEAVVIESDATDAKTKATMGTFESHVRNMVHGVSEEWEYKMEVFYSHFPMQVRSEGDEVVIENFLGEKAPRRTGVHGDTVVEVSDEELSLRGPSIEDVGQTAADIEQLTRVSGKDTRVFQDGVYITEKPSTGGA
ncbi:50S ribosomal protein L6 [Haladaptatus sp. DYF46]|uniref:50S ribosomal protein L6 n=1 Tax=Haladaptatus sp. DYF46 TaxID=2886041 RepID=UPI001E3A31C7|nr:50S ribosomal protein L6 [Haladaptatus sp. DYF46]